MHGKGREKEEFIDKEKRLNEDRLIKIEITLADH